MAAEPDQIRERIEATRAELASDVDALADRTSPPRIVKRWKQKISDGMHNVTGKVMGVPAEVSEKVKEAPKMVADETRGNPIAAGVIAFGFGLLLASLIPETELEKNAARKLADSELGEQIREPLAESAAHMRDDLSASLKESGEHIGQTVKEAASSTMEDARRAV